MLRAVTLRFVRPVIAIVQFMPPSIVLNTPWSVPAYMRRDFHLPHLSVASVHQWVQAAAGTVPAEGEYTRWLKV